MDKVHFRVSGRKWRLLASAAPICETVNGGEYYLVPILALPF
jgi:hypothetical protein